MRRLSDTEIEKLLATGCTAEDWRKISVTENFSSDALREVHFIGSCTLGIQDSSKGNKITRTTLEECDIEDGVTICDVYEGIKGYRIASGVVIKRVQQLVFTSEEHCGEGFEATPLDETGSRSIVITDSLTAQVAYLNAFARHDETISQALEKLFREYALQETPKEKAFIATGSCIEDCGTLRNLHIKKASIVRNVPRLHRVTLLGATLGEGVVAENLLCLDGAIVEEGCTLHNCFVGEGSHLTGGFSAHDTLIFANCILSNGEASAAILGPHCVSAHRSTLLIGGCFSFFNAGSGTNQSNHHYRLGPIHFGIAERGCKSSSDSYILWPAYIGAYTKISGRILTRPDVSSFPFSSLSSRDYGVVLQPGAELASIGIYRDIDKWPSRDKRTFILAEQVEGTRACDLITYRFYNPYIVYRLLQGYSALKALQEKAPQANRYNVPGALIEANDLRCGMQYYRAALTLYLIEELDDGRKYVSLLNRCKSSVNLLELSGPSPHYDLLGAPVSMEQIEILFESLRSGTIKDLSQLQLHIRESCSKTLSLAASFHRVLEAISILYPKACSLYNALSLLLEEAPSSAQLLYKQALNDAERDLHPRRTTAFGIFAKSREEIRHEIASTRAKLASQSFLKQFSERTQELSEKIERLSKQLVAGDFGC